MPCKCRLCSKEHLDEYLSKIKLSKEIICLCGEKYSKQKLFNLGVLSFENNLRIKNKFINYYKEQLLNKCFICGKTSKAILFFNDLTCTNHINEKNINEFLHKITHYSCEKCYRDYKDIGFECLICKINHYFTKYQNMNN